LGSSGRRQDAHGCERRQPQGADTGPSARHDAEDDPEHGGEHQDPDDQRELVVAAEGLDGEALDGTGHPVDHLTGHGLDRRCQAVVDARDQLTGAERDTRRDQAGQRRRGHAGRGHHGPAVVGRWGARRSEVPGHRPGCVRPFHVRRIRRRGRGRMIG
jgi:hypothetical protein